MVLEPALHRSIIACDHAVMLSRVVKKRAKELGLHAVPPAEVTLAFLEKQRVPHKIVETLKACSVTRWMSVGSLTLECFANLPKANAKPNRRALQNGFLVVGSGLSGDPIAVELSNGEVAFLSHEILWSFDPECDSFEECVARSTLDLDTFWSRALTEPDFPCDFYGAGGG
jgi:hypothetical protein